MRLSEASFRWTSNKSVTKNNSWIVENKMSTSEYQHQQMVSNIFCSLTLEALVTLFHLLPARTVGRLLDNFGLNLKFIRAVGFLVFAPNIDEVEVGNFNLHVVNKDRNKHLIKQNKTTFLGEKKHAGTSWHCTPQNAKASQLAACLQSILQLLQNLRPDSNNLFGRTLRLTTFRLGVRNFESALDLCWLFFQDSLKLGELQCQPAIYQ